MVSILDLNLEHTRIPKQLWMILLVNALGLASIFATKKGIQFYKMLHYQKLTKSRKRHKENRRIGISIREFHNEPNVEANADRIISMKLHELINYLKSSENNYRMVFNSYQYKAFRVDLRLNCIVEYLNLDINNVNLAGPLAGLPISFKDNFKIRGYGNYIGCSYFLNRESAQVSSVLVQIMEELGGIPFVKTTVPQTMMTICSSNPIDGKTCNPQSINFQSGGSSSGEAALIGAHGSILGFGSDIGGSIRIPAAFCGIVGLKPTSGRITKKGKFSNDFMTAGVTAAFGPMARDVDSIIFVLRHLFNSNLMAKYDPIVPSIPFDETIFSKPTLKIGYFYSDESYPVMPAMKRAVIETVHRLEAEGHELIPWKPPKTGHDWMRMYVQSISPDGAQCLERLLRYETIDPSIKNGIMHADFSFPQWLFNWVKFRLFYWLADKDQLDFYRFTKCKDFSGKALNERLDELSKFKSEVQNSWTRLRLDAVICPAGGFTAIPFTDIDKFYLPLLSSIFIWNLVDFPAGTVPVTKVTSDDIDSMLVDDVFKQSSTLRGIKEAQKNTCGLSVSVQCVALPWREEACLNLMKMVESSVNM